MTTRNYLGSLALVKKAGDTLHIADLANVSEGLLTETALADALADYATSADVAGTVANSSAGATVGSGTNPVYVNAGTVAASTSTVGGAAKPVYMSSGTLTACSSTIGSGVKPVYMSSGTVTASSSSVGGTAQPVYMNSGTITAGSQVVVLSGSRGSLAGYSTTGTATTITATSADSNVTSSAVTVSNGSSGTEWCKVVRLTASSPSVTLGSSWAWAGGTTPTLSQYGLLVLCWCGAYGSASFISYS